MAGWDPETGRPTAAKLVELGVDAAAPSGPVPLPSVLLTRQTNARNQVAGRFIAAMPALPHGWKGSGNSYAYYTFATGRFTVCATADGTGANSDGGTTCP